MTSRVFRPSTTPMFVEPIPADQAIKSLDQAASYWGFFLTPTQASLQRCTGAEWQSNLTSQPLLTEARVFRHAEGREDDFDDVHIIGVRAVRLRALQSPDSSANAAGGTGWIERERRSRLWGQWNAKAAGWYEERIPLPLSYRGYSPSPPPRYLHLTYREYIRAGLVEYVRYLAVGGDR